MTDERSPEETQATERIAELERRLSDQETAHHARLAQAELKAHAMRAGMIDVDGLKLIDVTNIKITPSGEIENADHLMAELRRAKPWLFQAASSSTPAATPPTTPPVAKRATAMSHGEWRLARAELLKRR